MFRSFTSFFMRSISQRICAVNSAGELPTGRAPTFSSFARSSGVRHHLLHGVGELRDDLGRHALAGASRPYHASSVKPFMPASSIVMTSGSRGSSAARSRRSPSACRRRSSCFDDGNWSKRHVDLPAHDVLHGRPRALVRDVDDLHARLGLERLAQHVVDAAHAGGRVRVLAGARLQHRDEFGEVLRRERWG